MEKKQIQINKELAGREKLRREKPYVLEKILKYNEKNIKEEYTPILEFIYDHKCNMSCSHCCNAKYVPKDKCLTPESVKMVADQADEIGIAQISISGGEPLLFEDLEAVVKAIGPHRFHISISTNGFFLTPKKAIYLKRIGIDKVKISVDSIDEKIYMQTRKQSEGLNKAIDALFNAKNAGLQAVAQTVVTHQTCKTEQTEKLARFCQENDFNLDLLIARAIGNWEGNEDVLIDEDDAKYLLKLHEKYPVAHRDTFPTYGEKEGSCGAVKKIIVVTKYGDVLPCVFIHISIGNIFDMSLKDIINNGLSIRCFSNRNTKCLSGEDHDFIQTYMSKFYGKAIPVSYKEVFESGDFIKKD